MESIFNDIYPENGTFDGLWAFDNYASALSEMLYLLIFL